MRVNLSVDPTRDHWVVPALALILIAVGLWLLSRPTPPPAWPPTADAPADGYCFCTWNVENLFDDRDDPSDHDADETWFGRNPEAVREKVGLLAHALLAQNGGRGPDILVAVEVENRRAAALLRDALNARLAPADRYTGLVFRENRSGRRIAPALLTRLPVRDDLTRSYPPRRILEAHLVGPSGAPLVVLASHWTSRLRDGSEVRREAYADLLYQVATEQLATDPAADLLIAGDFNDTPEDPSVVERLHAVADPESVLEAERRGREPLLLDLSARLDPSRGVGTYRHEGRWEVLDHIVVTPGLLDSKGWRVLPGTLRVEAPPALRFGRDGRPWRFGGPSNRNPRGPSDHFAVSVRLTVSGTN